jgi:hypothetical protein
MNQPLDHETEYRFRIRQEPVMGRISAMVEHPQYSCLYHLVNIRYPGLVVELDTKENLAKYFK